MGDFIPLGSVKQKSGKQLIAWAIQQDVDTTTIKSNIVKIEWPAKSGKHISVPEIERGEWCSIPRAMEKLNPGQLQLFSRLIDFL